MRCGRKEERNEREREGGREGRREGGRREKEAGGGGLNEEGQGMTQDNSGKPSTETVSPIIPRRNPALGPCQ